MRENAHKTYTDIIKVYIACDVYAQENLIVHDVVLYAASKVYNSFNMVMYSIYVTSILKKITHNMSLERIKYIFI